MATHLIDLKKAQSDLPKLIREVMSGDEVTITLEREPVVKLVPIPPGPTGPRRIGTAKGMVRIHKGFKELPEGFEELVP